MFQKLLWRGYYRYNVAPKIPLQQKITLSKLAIQVRNNMWYSFIDNQFRQEKHDMMDSSPMRKLARTVVFQEHIEDEQMFREMDHAWMMKNPIRLLTIREKTNIESMARQMRFTRSVSPSKMHQFISRASNHASLMYLATCHTYKYVRMAASPLHRWTESNGLSIVAGAEEIQYIHLERSRVLSEIGESLAKNYCILYRKYMLREYRRQHRIPEVQFLDGCSNYAIIIFPADVQIVDRFLADSNLEGFRNFTLWTGKNHFQSYATSLLAATDEGVTINDLTDAAQTFKNISHLTHRETQVQILADSSKIVVPDLPGSTPRRHIEFYFVRRDRSRFRQSDFKSCTAKINEFIGSQPGSELTSAVGFVNRWLSDTMVIRLVGPATEDLKYDNLSTDLIQVINLTKGVIFQKIVDRTCWIHLPLLRNSALE
jgi:hypothetical protein